MIRSTRSSLPQLAAALALTFALVSAAGQAQHAPPPEHDPDRPDPRTLTAADWRADLGFLAEAIQRQHPRPFHSITKEAFEAEVRALHERLPDLDYSHTLTEFTRLVAKLGPGDGHSRVRLERGFVQSQVPLRFWMFEDDPWIFAAAPEHAGVVGKRVVSIGGVPASEAIARVGAITAADNGFNRKLIAPLMLGMPEILQGLDLATADGVVLELDTGSDTPTASTTSHTIPFVPWPENGDGHTNPAHDPWRLGAPADWALMRGSEVPAPLYLSRPHDWYWSQELASAGADGADSAEGKVLYAQVNVIGNQDDKPSLRDFYGELLERAESESIDKLILDLRLNGGGNNFYNRAFIHGMIRSDTKNARGRTYVLIGRNTFSAAQNLVTKLGHETEVVFAGEPTGGSPNHYGDARRVTLPRSGLQVSISTLYWQDGGPQDQRTWVPPDIAVDLTAADFAAGRDPVLDAILAVGPDSVGQPFEQKVTAAYEAEGIDAAIAAYKEYRDDPTHRYVETESLMNEAGYFLLGHDLVDDAIRIFTLNVDAYPESWNAYDSLGEALLEAGRYHEAAQNYTKSLELNPGNENGQRMLEKSQAAASAHSERE